MPIVNRYCNGGLAIVAKHHQPESSISAFTRETLKIIETVLKDLDPDRDGGILCVGYPVEAMLTWALEVSTNNAEDVNDASRCH
jgi:hypothetical protein